MNTTTQTPATQNDAWGFYGTMNEQAEAAWPLAMTAISDATCQPLESVRTFLDSRHGRHFADDVQNGLYAGASLADAIAQATQGRSLPQLIRNFLELSWCDALTFILLRNGEDSEEWRRACEVAEQLAAILRKRTDTPEQMRDWLPPYLVRAIDYVTGGYVPGAPATGPEPDSEDEEIGAAGMEGAAAVEG